jgi:hypothetical protein
LDSQRFFSVLHECVKSGHIDGKKTQHKVCDACHAAREIAITKIKNQHGIDVWKSSEERSFSLSDLESFTKFWIHTTIQEVKAKGTQEGCGPQGILSPKTAVFLFDSLVQEKAFPQIMIRSLEENWPSTPWSFCTKQVQKAFGGDDPLARRAEPHTLDLHKSSKSAAGGLNAKYNAKIQRQRGYGRRRMFQQHVKREENVTPEGDAPLPSALPPPPSVVPQLPPPPPPPNRQRSMETNAPRVNEVMHFSTEDELSAWWNDKGGGPHARPPPVQGRERCGMLVKYEGADRERSGWQDQTNSLPPKVKKPNFDSDSEDDYCPRDRIRRSNLNGSGPILGHDFKGKSYGRGDEVKGKGKGGVKEELGEEGCSAW